METRTIKITFDKAKEWYFSEDPILKELALQAFTKKELEIPSYDDIKQLIPSYTMSKETDVLMKLSLYYRRSEDNLFLTTGTKYFIGQIGYQHYKIMKHDTVRYPGVPYFKRLEDVREAAKIFADYFKVIVELI
jgi:hypothetical protein